jgi:cellulose synthase/poly-beta-1,6-N-acetylglucosamine synthase-like glycosyltransferase
VSPSITIAVATFGDRTWRQLAATRAVPSAERQGVPVVHVHAGSLAEARNQALAQVDTEWVVHLDADDELEPGYVDAMRRATEDIRAPAVRYVYRPGRPDATVGIPQVAGHSHACEAGCLAYGNWLIVGAMVRADLVRAVGGWRDYPVYEDYDLWSRCWQAGATFEAVPDAVYRAWVRPGSRNRGTNHTIRHATHQAIARANGLPIP